MVRRGFTAMSLTFLVVAHSLVPGRAAHGAILYGLTQDDPGPAPSYENDEERQRQEQVDRLMYQRQRNYERCGNINGC